MGILLPWAYREKQRQDIPVTNQEDTENQCFSSVAATQNLRECSSRDQF
jgi:hypothetical protein